MSKKFGQNFMIGRHAREELVRCMKLQTSQTWWEVGPGLGALTHHIVDSVKKLRVFEIDHGFIRILQKLFGECSNFFLTSGDAIKTSSDAWKEDTINSKVDGICGNLPYNAASAFIMHCLENNWRCRMVYTVQKEGAERMACAVDSENYSSFSVQCQARYRVEIPAILGPQLFYPEPEVQSAIVSLDPRDDYIVDDFPSSFGSLVRSSFVSRRKTLENNLKSSSLAKYPGMDSVRDSASLLGIDLKRRAETVSPDEFLAWARLL